MSLSIDIHRGVSEYAVRGGEKRQSGMVFFVLFHRGSFWCRRVSVPIIKVARAACFVFVVVFFFIYGIT